ncbi:esterase-like activity of phytase family protein [Campylobacter geochelonis]|uniref:esterase-like activity of phytase family protein n=1 Tax=Campylobacter geochelonis TaxID=1780362 RepID=UPI000770998D|nr:esterase-like activity of phytase family protein [Campylobacter geochelonis]CZE51126.1 putative periplasmic protein [Campylobacter geochelonis]
MKKFSFFVAFILVGSQLLAAQKFSATLAGHAILPAASFINVPDDAPELLRTNGKFEKTKRTDRLESFEGMSNGRPTGVMYPFSAQPAQGHSGIISLGDDRFVLLSDNGLGNKLNSKDSALFYNIYKVDFKTGEFKREKSVFLHDPNKKVPFAIQTEATKERYLTGGDFDPEGIQFVGEFVYIGDEFGPYIIKADKNGVVVDVFDTIVDGNIVRSPDNPALTLPNSPDENMPKFEVSRSKGFEAMALSKDKTKLYPLLEGALFDYKSGKKESVDGKNYLRILEFDIKKDTWSKKSWKYILEANDHAIGDFNMIDEKHGLIIERDNGEGTSDKACKNGEDKSRCFADVAKFKRIYKVWLSDDGIAKKLAYIDLLDIEDTRKISKKPLVNGKFVFPFFTIENVDVVDKTHIVVGNDNNYPKSSSREPNKADDNELILLDVGEFLK